MINWKYVPFLILKIICLLALLIVFFVALFTAADLVYYVFSFIGR